MQANKPAVKKKEVTPQKKPETKEDKAEIIVNKGPIKPLLALNIFTPSFGDSVVSLFGVKEMSRKRIQE